MDYKYRHRETYKGIKIDVRAHTSAELNRKVNKKKDSIDRNIIVSSTLLQDCGEQYLAAYKQHTVSQSAYQDLQYILKALIRGIGNKPLSQIRPLHLQNHLNSLVSYSDSYIKKQYDLLCQIFHYAFRNGCTPTDYSEDLTRPRGKAEVSGRSLTAHERRVLLSVLDGHRGELFCKLILYCGMRPSEVQALQWKDIDLKSNTILISKSMKRDGSIGQPKTKSAYRDVPIPLHLLPLLKSSRKEAFEYLFPLSLTWRRRMWDNVKREMNLAMGCATYRNKLVPPYPLADDFTLYNLRHTYCTDLEKAGVPINIASRLMGHANITITSKVYTHASVEALELARALIDGQQRGQESV